MRLTRPGNSSSTSGSFGSAIPLIETPKWEGKLLFRHAGKEESGHLKSLYEASWGNGIGIATEQIEAMITNFPEGQIVGCEANGRPISMINIMLTEFLPENGFRAGYEKITGGRTFSTHIAPEEIMARARTREDMLRIALCVSIAVHPEYMRNGFASETLNYAISFAELNGFTAVPYSAPRGFGKARKENPNIDIYTYLHMTKPSDQTYDAHIARLERVNMARKGKILGGHDPDSIRDAIESLYSYYLNIPGDKFDSSIGEIAFTRFLMEGGILLERLYGREMTIEDFCLLTGRKHVDPTMRMHIENGARFIRDQSGNIAAVFEGSRPEDNAAAGYNVVLSYGYSNLLGHDL